MGPLALELAPPDDSPSRLALGRPVLAGTIISVLFLSCGGWMEGYLGLSVVKRADADARFGSREES